MGNDLTSNLEPLIATMARIFAAEGKAREVAVLANAKPQIEQTDYDNWNGGICGYSIYLQVPPNLYFQLSEDRETIEKSLLEKSGPILRPFLNEWLKEILIVPLLSSEEGWQDKAKSWVSGKGVTNQGRVRSDNIASKTADGLLFRSEPEINLYKALKSQGVSFAPLPVFIRGGQEYRRIEPDFVILKDGIIMVVEVDGDTVHQETPAEAHARTTMLIHEGAYLERVKASECSTPELAQSCAKKLLQVLAKLKASR